MDNDVDSFGDATTLERSYLKAKTQEKQYKAKLVELSYQKESGKVVENEAVRREAFEKGRKLRDILLGYAKKTAPFVACESDVQKCEDILDDAIKKIIVDYLERDK